MARSSRIISFFQLIRWPNILIMVAVQWVIYYLHVLPTLSDAGIESSNNWIQVFLFMVCTGLIGASGNVINDISDQLADSINRPTDRLVGRKVTEKQAIIIYGTLVILGFLIAMWLAWTTNKWNWLWIYPAAILGLFFYSKRLKCLPLVGNAFIGMMCGLVFISIAFLEWEHLVDVFWTETGMNLFWQHLLHFSWLAFLLTVAREIIKDMEDVEGDLEAHCTTIPILWGLGRSRWLVIAVLILIISDLIIWMRTVDSFMVLIYAVLSMILPLAILLIVLSRNWENHVLRKASSHIKFVMLSAIIFMILIA